MNKPPQQPLTFSGIQRRVTLLYILYLGIVLAALLLAGYLLFLYSENTPRAPVSPTPTRSVYLLDRGSYR